MKKGLIILSLILLGIIVNNFKVNTCERLPIPQFTSEEMQMICIEEEI